jgi:hypothetical protein
MIDQATGQKIDQATRTEDKSGNRTEDKSGNRTEDRSGNRKEDRQQERRWITLLDGTNVRLNWNIESDLNVYLIKFKNFLSLYWFKNKQY